MIELPNPIEVVTSRSAGKTALRPWHIWALTGVVLVALLVAPFVANAYVVTVLYMVMVYTLGAYGFNLLSGFSGYITFGFVGWFAVGAYSTALVIGEFGVPWYVGLLAGGLSGAVLAAVLYVALFSLQDWYFAIATLVTSEVLRILYGGQYLDPYTGGGQGYAFAPGVSLNKMYFALFVVLCVLLYLTYRLATSQFGLKLMALREDEVAAQSMGINRNRTLFPSFVASMFVAGIAGGFLVLNLSYLDPTSIFNPVWSLEIIVVAAFGGLGTVLGPIYGALVIILGKEYLWGSFPHLSDVFLGLFFILLLVFIPQGLIRWLQDKEIIEFSRAT